MPNLRDLDVQVVSLVDRAAVRNAEDPTQPQRLLVWKADTQGAPTMPPTPEELAATLAKAETDRDAVIAKAATDAEALTKAQADVTALTEKVAALEKAAKPTDGEDGDEDVDLEKADPAVRKALAKAAADSAALTERLEKSEKATEAAETLAKAERETRLTHEFVTKAEGYKALVVKAEEFGPVLKSASEKLSKDEYAELDRVLKAADAGLVASELFKEQGRSGQPSPDADSAIAEVQSKAAELKKADPKLSDGEALQKAMSSDKELQARYLAENR